MGAANRTARLAPPAFPIGRVAARLVASFTHPDRKAANVTLEALEQHRGPHGSLECESLEDGSLRLARVRRGRIRHRHPGADEDDLDAGPERRSGTPRRRDLQEVRLWPDGLADRVRGRP